MCQKIFRYVLTEISFRNYKVISLSGTFALKFSEKSFQKGIKFFLGTVDIVSVRTKTLSAREVSDIPGGRSPILGGQAAEAKTN